MGLLNHVSSLKEKTKKRKGLLSTAESLRCTSFFNEENTLLYNLSSLHSLLNGLGILRFALCVPFNKKYEMIFNHGFNFETILQSSSSIDFWNGLFDEEIEENTWYSQSEPSIDSFLQLFSLEDREYISILHIKFFTFAQIPNCIVLITQQKKSPSITDYLLDSFDENFNNLQPNINFIVQKYISCIDKKIETDTLYDKINDFCNDDFVGLKIKIDTTKIFTSIIEKTNQSDSMILFLLFDSIIKKNIDETSVFYKKDFNTINLIFFSQKEEDFDLIVSNIKKSLQIDFFHFINEIKFTNCGYSSDAEDLLAFMD